MNKLLIPLKYLSSPALFALIFILFFSVSCKKQPSKKAVKKKVVKKEKLVQKDFDTTLQVGASQMSLYLPDLKNQRVAMVVNHTSLIGNTHLVDSLLKLNVSIKKIFAPEHGFRGEADAGETVSNSMDSKTGLPLISLYGKNKKPSSEQLSDIDVVIFDMQDVGARFYTYISTMHYVMEACAENNKKVMILDRPNPNGNYIDGPVLKLKFKSFVGMHPIPVVHGLTVGELAMMINGEHWLSGGFTCDLKVIKNKNYTHQKEYILPVRPSPNLPNQQSIKLYPSICLFEGTKISVGRGTGAAFQVIGAPDSSYGKFTFIPKSIFGAKKPMFEDKICYGLDLTHEKLTGFTLKYLIDFYQKSPQKDKFFNSYFDTIAGGDELKKQIISGMAEDQIRLTWQQDLEAYKNLRKKYLLYE